MTSNPVQARTNDETQIRQLMEDWRSALANRDLDKLIEHYSPDVLFFDVIPPYQHRGVEAYRRTWEQMFPHLPPRISVQQRDVEITVGGDWPSHIASRASSTPTQTKTPQPDGSASPSATSASKAPGA
jgi:uncharacterized protein (TIGR02246 family)